MRTFKPTFFTSHPRLTWLLGGLVALLLLIAAVVLLAPRLLSSPAIKQKIQTVVSQKTGGELDFQTIDLSYLPRPGIELQEVRLAFPGQAQGTIVSLRMSPELLPLLQGNMRLSALELDSPQLSLVLPAANADMPAEQPVTVAVLQEKIRHAGKALGPLLSGVDAEINNGQITLSRDKNKLATMAGVDLTGTISAADANTAEVQLTASLAELIIFRHDQQQTLKKISMRGSARMTADTLQASLTKLALDEPRLTLNGDFACAQAQPNCTLQITGEDIDVAATRTTALKLAGDTTPIKQIGKYLRGGQVTKINVTSQADQPSGLGEFTSILIKGRLQEGKIAVPEIKLKVSDVTGDVVIDKGILQANQLSARLKNSTASDGSLQLGLTKDSNLFLVDLAVDAELAEMYSWLSSLDGLQGPLQKISEVRGRVDISSLKLQGPLDKPAAWTIHSTGTVRHAAVKTELFPAAIDIAGGQYTMDPGQLELKKIKAAGMDAQLTVSGSIKGLPQQLKRLDLSLDGSIGKEAYTWLASQLKLPDAYTIQTPFTVSDGKVSWQPDATTSFAGQVKIDKGPTLNGNVDYARDRLQIHQLTVKDQYSDASMVLDLAGKKRKGTFSGRLQHQTLQDIFVDSAFNSGRLDGDISVAIDSTGQGAVTVKGQLKGDNLPLVLPSADQVQLGQVKLQGDGTDITVDIASLTWEKLTWSPVKAKVFFDKDRVEIKIIEAGLCGIDSPGSISTNGTTYSFNMSLSGNNLNVADSYSCLTSGAVRMTGTLDFSSQVTAKGKMDRLVKRMQGPLQMTFSNGVIQQSKILARVLEVLNVTEIIKGRLPDLTTKGLRYNTMTIEGQFREGLLTVDKYHLNGETLDLVGQGTINLVERTLDMQLVAAPLQTIDSIVRHIPGINYLLGGSLISIPVSISGPATDPKVSILSPSAVSSGVFNLAKRTIKAPFKLLDALTPWTNNKE